MRKGRLLLVLTLCVCLGNVLPGREPVRAKRAMVVSQEPLATDVGVEVLKGGGNAVDAAIAVALALAVTHPSAGNIGGGGFLLVRFADGRTTFLDFRERAPLAATRTMYVLPDGKVSDDSRIGWRASGVPGTIAGLEYASKKYGKKPWADLVHPAIRLAADGIPLSYAEATSICSAKTLMQRFPESTKVFFKNGNCYDPGDRLYQPDLAATLSRVAKDGAAGFYEGETAKRLAAEMQANGGLITSEDLKQYKVTEREPLRGSYKGYDIITAPLPSSGGIGLLMMAGMLDGSGYEKAGAESAMATHWMAEAMRRYYADRARYMGDADFAKVPVKQLLDPAYLAKLRASILPDKATPSAELGGGTVLPESPETTHFNVIDEEGNAVSFTYTLNGSYGSGVTAPGLGFLLNNEMDDFAAKPGEPNMFGLIQGDANAIQPGKRPLSSMTPTIVLKDGKLFMTLGAPGGARIISGVTQVFLNVVDFDMNVQRAIDQPRAHMQWMPDKLYLEWGYSPDTKALLRNMGYDLNDVASVGSVEAILVGNGWLQGAQNGRSSGKAAGY